MTDEKDTGDESPPFSLADLLEEEFQFNSITPGTEEGRVQYDLMVMDILCRLRKRGRTIAICSTRRTKEKLKQDVEAIIGCQPLNLTYHIAEEDINER